MNKPSAIFKLGMKNIRCFRNEHLVIKPLTLLLGDNSTGKSTSLASAQAVLQTLMHPISTSWESLHQNPYAKGNYDNVIRQDASNPNSHNLDKGFVLTHESPNLISRLRFIRDAKRFKPTLDSMRFKIRSRTSDDLGLLNIKFFHGSQVEMKCADPSSIDIRIPSLYFYGATLQRFLQKTILPLSKNINNSKYDTGMFRKSFRKIVNGTLDGLPEWSVYNSPPVKPPARRIYRYSEYEQNPAVINQAMELFDFSTKHPIEWEALIKIISDEGEKLDLFSKFYLKKYIGLLKRFEIMAMRDGREINICDMGVGTWHILQPLIALRLADIMKERRFFMFQQSDEHAHPRLQEHLASSYCKGLANGHRFLIETHSDYILNKVSTEISKGSIDPDLVGVAFYSHDVKKNSCRIHNRDFNSNGKIMNMPEYFKDYYGKNTRSFLH